MTQEYKTVFISYRREPAWAIAQLVYGDLREHGYDVFMDVKSLGSGAFDTTLLEQIERRAHFVLILTSGTVERCVEPDDWLRSEIEHAMSTRRNIIPLLVYGFSFNGTEKYLTGKLSQLHRYNGLPLDHFYLNEGLSKLRNQFLKQPIYGEIKPTLVKDQLIVQQQVDEVANQPAPTAQELSAEDYFNRGQLFLDNDDIEGAIRSYDEAIWLNSQYAEAYHRRGIAKRRRGDVNGAMDDQTHAIGLSPQYAEAYNNRASAKAHIGDIIGALKDYEHAISINQSYAAAYSNRAEVYFILGKYELALADFREATRLRPTYNMSRAGLAITLYLLEQKSEAKAIWNALIEQDTRYRNAKWVGNVLHWEQAHTDAARELISELQK